ncbi:MAG: sigma-54-dependent Fis family transcriptional regulator [Verrucomicrobiales bacterium]|nr:sigma-54-dependent Fis family transcriptional regulator [Verrucomicrobiales bacterium]
MTDTFECLIVEDDANFASQLQRFIETEGGRGTHASTLQEARALLGSKRFDLVILDNRLPDGTGHAFHADVVARAPEAKSIMITGAPELSQAVALTRNGLSEYLTKPVDLAALEAALQRIKLSWRIATPDPGTASQTLGQAPAFRAAMERLHSVARHPDAMVLLLGETGTGKDMAARQLHAWATDGHPASRPFIAVNCSAVPADMFEAELFGSERGAYTGADRRRSGLVEAAAEGTLFLDEIGDVPLALQSKLLRFLESREYRALGSTATRRFEGRVVCATNRDLAEEVQRGRFRQDLLYRLDVVRVQLPPLRERAGDIPELTAHLLEGLCARYGRPRLQLRPDDAHALLSHSFPGNVRELRNILERSVLHSDPSAVWLALDRSWLPSTTAVASASTSATPAAASAPRRQLTPLEQQEYETFRRVLQEEGGAIRRTAARLGVSHQVVLRRLRWWPELRHLTETAPPES